MILGVWLPLIDRMLARLGAWVTLLDEPKMLVCLVVSEPGEQ